MSHAALFPKSKTFLDDKTEAIQKAHLENNWLGFLDALGIAESQGLGGYGAVGGSSKIVIGVGSNIF